jgi:hypothetical protein
MTLERGIVLIVVVCCCLTAAGAPVSGGGAASSAADSGTHTTGASTNPPQSLADTNQSEATGNESAETAPSLGAAMSTFMHANTESISASIDSRLFGAAMTTATNDTKATLVATRIDAHAAELAALEREHERLASQNGSGLRYEARHTRLSVRITALNRSLAQTRAHAETVPVSVNTTRLDRLRGDLRALEANVSAMEADHSRLDSGATTATPDTRLAGNSS